MQGKTTGESDNDDSCNAIDDPRRARPGKPSLRGVGSRDDEGEPGQREEDVYARKWILRSLRAGVPLLGEPSFRVGVSHRAVAG